MLAITELVCLVSAVDFDEAQLGHSAETSRVSLNSPPQFYAVVHIWSELPNNTYFISLVPMPRLCQATLFLCQQLQWDTERFSISRSAGQSDFNVCQDRILVRHLYSTSPTYQIKCSILFM